MPRKLPVGANDLFLIASYLNNSDAKTEIHAEIPARYRDDFEAEYAHATDNFPLPPGGNQHPHYAWPQGTNKRGRQLRIYFALFPPQPPLIQDLNPVYGQWIGQHNLYRINHTNLVMQLFECGFVLGKNQQNAERIAHFMRRKFPVTP